MTTNHSMDLKIADIPFPYFLYFNSLRSISLTLYSFHILFHFFGVLGFWSKTSFAKRFDADKKRSATTDFDRFKIMVLRKQRSFAAKTKNAKAAPKAAAKAAPAKAAAKKR